MAPPAKATSMHSESAFICATHDASLWLFASRHDKADDLRAAHSIVPPARHLDLDVGEVVVVDLAHR